MYHLGILKDFCLYSKTDLILQSWEDNCNFIFTSQMIKRSITLSEEYPMIHPPLQILVVYKNKISMISTRELTPGPHCTEFMSISWAFSLFSNSLYVGPLTWRKHKQVFSIQFIFSKLSKWKLWHSQWVKIFNKKKKWELEPRKGKPDGTLRDP